MYVNEAGPTCFVYVNVTFHVGHVKFVKQKIMLNLVKPLSNNTRLGMLCVGFYLVK